jgi:protein-S-isoprenylcysteine O-methyltransferase Ste14
MRLLLKNLIFTILVPGTVAVYLPYRIIVRGGADAFHPARLWVAGPLLILGVATYLWCLYDFAVTGRGTPAPIDPPKHLVVRGLYRYVRNPMYVGVLLVIAGWSALSGSWALVTFGVGVALAFHLFVVFVEEPTLQRRFGDAYDRYRAAVPRWVPRPPKRELSA